MRCGLQKRVYRAESPDEGALVEGAASVGYVLLERTNVSVTVKLTANQTLSKCHVLAINAFNSTRKRCVLFCFVLNGLLLLPDTYASG